MEPCSKAPAHALADYLAVTLESVESFAARAGTDPAVIAGLLEGRALADLASARRIEAASGGAAEPAELMSAQPCVVFGRTFGETRAINARLLAAVIEMVAPQVFRPECPEAAFVAAAASNIYDALAGVSALSRTDRLAEALRPALQDSFAASPDCGEPDAAARLAARLYLTAESHLSA